MLAWLAANSEGIQAAVLIIAAIAGSFWTLFQFVYARRQERIRRQSVLRMDLTAQPARLPGDPRLFLNVVVTIENTGDRNTHLSYDSEDHLTVTGISFDEAGAQVRGPTIKRRLMRGDQPVSTNTLLAGQSNDLPFMVPIPGPGLFHVRYYVRPNEWQMGVLRQAGGLTGTNSVVLSTNKLIIVSDE